MIETKKQALDRLTCEIEDITQKIFSGDHDPMDDMSQVYKLSYAVWEYLGNYLSHNGWTEAEKKYGSAKADMITIRTGAGKKTVPLFDYMSKATDQIMEKIIDCIKYYTPDKGTFLHYFNSSFNKGHVIAEMDRESQSGGMTYRDTDSYTDNEEKIERAKRREKEDQRFIRKIHSFFYTHPEININEQNLEELFALFSEDTNTSLGVKRFKKLFSEYCSGTPISIHHTICDEDGDEVAVIDMVADQKASNAFDEVLINNYRDTEETITTIFNQLNVIFLSTGYETEKSRKIKKVFLTSELAQAIAAGKYFEFVKEKDFFDEETYMLVTQKEKKLQKKEIAEICGCSAANVTKIINSFKDAIQGIQFEEE